MSVKVTGTGTDTVRDTVAVTVTVTVIVTGTVTVTVTPSYSYGPISHSPAIGINHSTLLHKLLLIFISTFFASNITLTKTG